MKKHLNIYCMFKMCGSRTEIGSMYICYCIDLDAGNSSATVWEKCQHNIVKNLSSYCFIVVISV